MPIANAAVVEADQWVAALAGVASAIAQSTGAAPPIAGVEANINNFACQPGFFQRAQHADGAGLIDREYPVDLIAMLQEEVSRLEEGIRSAHHGSRRPCKRPS